MKNKIYILVAILLCILAVVIFTTPDDHPVRLSEEELIGTWVSTNLLWEEKIQFSKNEDDELISSGEGISSAKVKFVRRGYAFCIGNSHEVASRKNGNGEVYLTYIDGDGLTRRYSKLTEEQIAAAEQKQETLTLEEQHMGLIYDSLLAKLSYGIWKDGRGEQVFTFSNYEFTSNGFNAKFVPFTITHMEFANGKYCFNFTAGKDIYTCEMERVVDETDEHYTLVIIKNGDTEIAATHEGCINTAHPLA